MGSQGSRAYKLNSSATSLSLSASLCLILLQLLTLIFFLSSLSFFSLQQPQLLEWKVCSSIALLKSDAIWSAFQLVTPQYAQHTSIFATAALSLIFVAGVQAPLAQLSARALRNDRSLHECLSMLMQVKSLGPLVLQLVRA